MTLLKSLDLPFNGVTTMSHLEEGNELTVGLSENVTGDGVSFHQFTWVF